MIRLIPNKTGKGKLKRDFKKMDPVRIAVELVLKGVCIFSIYYGLFAAVKKIISVSFSV